MLPVWKIEPAKRQGFVKWTCPRRDCRGIFWSACTLIRDGAARTHTVPCPHCFRVGSLPENGPSNTKVRLKASR